MRVSPYLKLSGEPLLVIPIIEREVYTRFACFPKLIGIPYHDYIDVHKPILIGDGRKITKSRDMLNTPKLLHDRTWEIPGAPPNAYQGNTEQIDTMGLSLPSSNTPFDPPAPVSGA